MEANTEKRKRKEKKEKKEKKHKDKKEKKSKKPKKSKSESIDQELVWVEASKHEETESNDRGPELKRDDWLVSNPKKEKRTMLIPSGMDGLSWKKSSDKPTQKFLDSGSAPSDVSAEGNTEVTTTDNDNTEQLSEKSSEANVVILDKPKSRGEDFNYDANFAKAIIHSSKRQNVDTDELDDSITSETSGPRKKKAQAKEEQKVKQQAISAYNRQQKVLDTCWFCFENPKLDRSLIVSIGNLVYLALPKRGTLTEGHCLIIPMQHVVAANATDEDVWEEIMLFRKSLAQMFASQKKQPLFIECVTNIKKQHHTFIECVPLPKDEFEQAPIYFKKAINESESEWSQHKKLIDTTGKGMRRGVPEGFPYFNVEFANTGGYSHVIEDEHKFPYDFAKTVIGGMLGLDSTELKFKNDSPETTRQRLKNFLLAWSPYDWTQQLDGGEYT